MSSIDTQTTSPLPATAGTTPGLEQQVSDSKLSGQDDFMKIFLAELQNQDPMEPMDNKDMVAQMAQMESVKQAIETNRQLTALQGMSSTQGRNAMAGLIGKGVDANASSLHFQRQGAEPVALTYDLTSPATEVVVQVLDINGLPVRTLHQPGTQASVNQSVLWDGKNEAGMDVANGDYQIKVTAVRGDSRDDLPARLRGTATGVSFDSNGAAVMVGNVQVRPQQITQINQ